MKKEFFSVSEDVLKSMKRIVDYGFSGENDDFCSMGCPKGHIFEDFVLIRDFLEKKFGGKVFRCDLCEVEVAYGEIFFGGDGGVDNARNSVCRECYLKYVCGCDEERDEVERDIKKC